MRSSPGAAPLSVEERFKWEGTKTLYWSTGLRPGFKGFIKIILISSVTCHNGNHESTRSRISPLWKTMSLDEFSTSTSLHGWHFIHDATDVKHKLAWGLLIGLSISIWLIAMTTHSRSYVLVIGLVSVYGIAADFFNSKVVITIDSPSASLDQVHFPSLTFCNVNQVSF